MRRKNVPTPLSVICVFIYVLHASWPNEKQYRPKIWYTFSQRPYLKTFFFFFFLKNHPDDDGRQPRKTAVSRGFSAYLLDCLVSIINSICQYFSCNIMGLTMEYSMGQPNTKKLFFVNENFPVIYIFRYQTLLLVVTRYYLLCPKNKCCISTARVRDSSLTRR